MKSSIIMVLAAALSSSLAFGANLNMSVDDGGSCAGAGGSWQTNVSGTSATFACVGNSSTPTPPTPTPTPPSTCSNYQAVYLGEIQFDGAQVNSTGVTAGKVAYAKLVIPAAAGKSTVAAVFEYGDLAYWKKVYLSKTPCSFAAATPSAFAQGTGANINLSIGKVVPGTVTVQPGEVWYLNIKNETMANTPSCPAGRSCNFAIRLYPPS